MLDVAFRDIGLGFIIAGILGLALVVNPKSPLRKYLVSTTELGVIIELNQPPQVTNNQIIIPVGLNALSDIRIDKIDLRVGRRKLTSDWKPKSIQCYEPEIRYFPRPNWLYRGKHEAYLKAYTPDGFSKSKKFTINVETDYEE